MHTGKRVFAQLMGHLPLHTFRQCVANYPSRYPTLKFLASRSVSLPGLRAAMLLGMGIFETLERIRSSNSPGKGQS